MSSSIRSGRSERTARDVGGDGPAGLPLAWAEGQPDISGALTAGLDAAVAALTSRGRAVVVEAFTPTFDLLTPQVVDFNFPLVDGAGGVRLYISTTRLVIVTRNAAATVSPSFQFEQNGALAGQAIAALSVGAFNGTGLVLPYNIAAATNYNVLDMTTHRFQGRINSAPSGGGITAATGFFWGTGVYR
jgi:hypothetical protein